MREPAPDDESLPVPVGLGLGAVLACAARCVDAGVPAVIATVLVRRGSSPATPGQKLVLTGDGECVGTVGGGALERAVLLAMRESLARAARGEGEPVTRSYNLGPSLGMCCGGGVDVLVEPLVTAIPVGVVGAGHVAMAVVPLLQRCGFAVTVVDARDVYAEPSRMPGARVLRGDHTSLTPWVSARGAVLVMTHDHALDQDALEWALTARYAFVGCVGSRAKCLRTRARLEAKGYPEADRARVRMPLGVPIGARSPDEIAVSVVAELIAWRRGMTDPSPLPVSL